MSPDNGTLPGSPQDFRRQVERVEVNAFPLTHP